MRPQGRQRGLMSLACASLLIGILPGAEALAAESMELRLLRTIWIGTPQGIQPEEIVRYAKNESTELVGYTLARTALWVIGERNGWPAWPLTRLLDKTMNELHRGDLGGLPADVPAGFGAEDLVGTLVYALVMSGQTDEAIDVLEPSLRSQSEFARAVALQMLRHIGTRRANGLVQQAADTGPDTMLAGNLLADQEFPFLHELAARWALIPPKARTREQLFAIASQQTDRQAELALYLLGFFPQEEFSSQSQREVDLLRRFTHESCHLARYFGIRSLALRSIETRESWSDLLRAEIDPWQRAQLVRIGFARFGRQFADAALERLADEPSQYVQWELMDGALAALGGTSLRDFWDLWQPATLQFRITFTDEASTWSPDAMDRVLSWLERGARPGDPAVRNQLLYQLVPHVHGEETLRLLAMFDSLPDKAQQWWVLGLLDDPSALPQLRAWQALDTSDEQREQLALLIQRLEAHAAPEAIGQGE